MSCGIMNEMLEKVISIDWAKAEEKPADSPKQGKKKEKKEKKKERKNEDS